MKTTILKYITVTFAAGAMLLAGCNDLDQEPTNKFTDKAFWTSPERANMVLNMAYNQMFGHDKIWQDEALSDNLYDQSAEPATIDRSGVYRIKLDLNVRGITFEHIDLSLIHI